jgi:hypothetical protein
MDLKSSELVTLVPIVLVCAAILATYQFIPNSSQAPQSPQISLVLDGEAPYVSGRAVTLRVFSTCGPFGIFVDNEKSGEGLAYAEMQLVLLAGRHAFEAKSSGCNATLAINVAALQCAFNQTEPCAVNGCQGVRTCSNGAYSSCILPRRVCVPGEKIGCSFDGCEFGHAICNPCGSGFGACVPDNATKIGVACGNGAQCT